MIKKKLTLEEQIVRFQNIGRYNNVLSEQEEIPDTEETGDEMGTEADEVDASTDMGAEMGTEETGDEGGAEMGTEEPMEDETEEIDITDLVNLTRSIKNDLDDKLNSEDDDISKQILGKLSSFDNFSVAIDRILNSIDNLSAKVDKMRQPNEVEKLEMRSLDSYPFDNKPIDFFEKKKREMEMSGKHEYILTKDDVRNYSPDQIAKSFNAEY